MSLREKIVCLLASLGATSQDVYEHLLDAGCFGQRSGNWSCPVYQYLNARLLGDGELSVCEDDVRLRSDSRWWEAARDRIYYAENGVTAIRDFIADFDADKYPALLAYEPEDESESE